MRYSRFERAREQRRRKAAKRNRIMLILFILFIAVYAYIGVLLFSGAEEEIYSSKKVVMEPVMEPEPEPVEITERESESELVTEAPLVQVYRDPNNYIYPYNVMSADWGAEVYLDGFKYLQIPEGCVKDGGCFPEVVQVYLWCLCEDRELDYYTVLSLIERESRYRYDASGDGGNSKGYMQIQERWHKDRMQEEGVADLCDPYGNIRVGLNFLDELYEKYGSMSKALMAYNMGESRAKQLWEQGILSTQYTRDIQERAQELRQELQD